MQWYQRCVLLIISYIKIKNIDKYPIYQELICKNSLENQETSIMVTKNKQDKSLSLFYSYGKP
ncbi:hypothetical protein CMU66_09405 [Elizabethkingia anophelis]|nr:hypothetical protein [Elizabethkingia anophelis]MDV3626329.1 hypothetical protein [Elizabethkingia anophelis]MDV3644006.1 hypothetical protein [Elizabethkingia anophelis]MDV3657036.1 hypothetical protein [Elizabethkingia anophelis]MDV3699065.1 hypothetical protein [Elizabethkingia anophelis]